MLSRNTQINNKLGFHLRAVSTIVQTAMRFQSQIMVSRNGNKRNGRSVLDLMLLEAGPGTQLTIEVEGLDEAEAMSAILSLFEANFGEE